MTDSVGTDSVGTDLSKIALSKIAKNLERFRQGVASHDRENPTHTAHGIGLSHHDMQRLGFDDGETLWPGITVTADGGQTANFRVLCDGEHDTGHVESVEDVVRTAAVGA